VEAVQTYRWTREAFERLGETGVLPPDARVELVNGNLVEMSPQGSQHATAVRKVEEALRDAFRSGFDVRPQLPLALSGTDEPEPDVAVVPGAIDDYRDAHPSEAVLVVEVADTSLDFDRNEKLRAYARGSVPEYWIVNLRDRCLEAYRAPAEGDYRTKQTFDAADTVQPSAQPERPIVVRDLLP
jgi:Uma2 family endonuclease